ncbi:YjzD family protein [Periweissella beninensis]|uniref:YjzD family protein n=1 Tax=Periweissella beninensis TaxID=504936 RepID=A0ABT0VJ06_9LACO|nr:YjzD family protein [Periweissella beninensis]MBM7545080.1 putative membrane protein [Periweissella beninensis]MCM2436375.1 YjzD family protein [Periweissella beninensis]MCT4396792.1 DUF2929 family protein [Periweissella beninensis]
MKYIIAIFWGAIFGEVLGYIGQALEGGTYSPLSIAVWSVIMALIGTITFSGISKSTLKEKHN